MVNSVDMIKKCVHLCLPLRGTSPSCVEVAPLRARKPPQRRGDDLTQYV